MIHRIRLLLLLSTAFIALAAHNAFAAQGEIIVAKSGGQFTSIQAAINSVTPSASNPYVIKVMPGTYTENVTMKSYISLQGSGRETTTIASPTLNSGTVVDIAGLTQVGIAGFTIANGYYGIRNESSSKISIRDNTLKSNYWAGSQNRSTGETVITGNNITDQSQGIGVIVDGNATTGPIIIENNYIARNDGGVHVAAAAPKIIGNVILSNSSSGISNIGNTSPEILNNVLSKNGGGITNWDNAAPNISGNTFTDTGVGVQCRGSSSGSIIGNVITGQYYGVSVLDYATPQILHNRITNNTYSDILVSNWSNSGSPNISFNIYDTISGTNGVGLYNVKSDGTPAPAP